MWDKLFTSVDLMGDGMKASWLRNSVIRNNIANVETPGFKASDVNFENLYYRALYRPDELPLENKRTRDRHIVFGDALEETGALVTKRRDLSMRYDENNVDIEDENVKLAQNSIMYNTLVEKLNSEIRRLNAAIKG